MSYWSWRRPLRRLSLVLAAVATILPAAANAADTYTRTQHPVVLVHGLFGWDRLLFVVDHFFGIADTLRAGGSTVYVPQVSAANSTELRGEQLLHELRRLQALHGHQKFNLIGHSQGGGTARYVAAVAPELVASVTTFATPHHGSQAADVIIAGTSITLTAPVVQAAGTALAATIALLSGSAQPQNLAYALTSLSTRDSRRFNSFYPQGAPTRSCGEGPEVAQGVRYYSYGSQHVLTSLADPLDALLATISVTFLGQRNDGIVAPCSTHWGRVIRDDLPWNHFDHVNQLFGLRGLFAPNPTAVYRAHVNRLKLAGV